MSFGSTLSEQEAFTDDLIDWVAFNLPAELPTPATAAQASDKSAGEWSHDLAQFQYHAIPIIIPHANNHLYTNTHPHIGHSQDWWLSMYDIAYNLSSWVPRMCLALAIMDGKTDPTAKKEKQAASCRVAIRQVSIIERILLSAYAEGDPLAAATVIGCVWAPPDAGGEDGDGEGGGAMLSPSGTGIMSCLEHLTGAGMWYYCLMHHYASK